MDNTLFINYTKEGNPIPDYKCEEEILKQASICVNGQNKEFQVSTENVVICARMLKMSGKLTCNLEIMFEGRLLEMNRYCVIVHGYPYGFCDYVDRWTAELLTRQISLKRKHQEILHPTKIEDSVKNVGVICVDSDDFINYRRVEGLDDDCIATRRKMIRNGVTYWKISSVSDLCSLTLDKIVETTWAKRNPHYDEIIYVVQSNLTSNK